MTICCVWVACAVSTHEDSCVQKSSPSRVVYWPAARAATLDLLGWTPIMLTFYTPSRLTNDRQTTAVVMTTLWASSARACAWLPSMRARNLFVTEGFPGLRLPWTGPLNRGKSSALWGVDEAGLCPPPAVGSRCATLTRRCTVMHILGHMHSAAPPSTQYLLSGLLLNAPPHQRWHLLVDTLYLTHNLVEWAVLQIDG